MRRRPLSPGTNERRQDLARPWLNAFNGYIYIYNIQYVQNALELFVKTGGDGISGDGAIFESLRNQCSEKQ